MDDDADSVGGKGPPGGPARLYSLDSNQSGSSFFEDVEMAHDEVRRPPLARSACRPMELWLR